MFQFAVLIQTMQMKGGKHVKRTDPTEVSSALMLFLCFAFSFVAPLGTIQSCAARSIQVLFVEKKKKIIIFAQVCA